MMMRILALAVLSVSLSACSKSDGDSSNIDPRQRANDVVLGEMYSTAQEIDKADFTDICQDKTRDAMFAVTKKLDSMSKRYHALIIQRMQAAPVTDKLGPILLRSLGEYEASPDWKKDEYMWDDYLKVLSQDEVTDNDLIKVVRYVTRMLSDEKGRRIEGRNKSIGRYTISHYKTVRAKIVSCLEQSSCGSIELENNEYLDLREYYWVRYRLSELSDNTRSLEEQRDTLERLKNYFSKWIRYYSFQPDPTIVRISDDVIELPLDAGDFAGVKDEVAKKIEQAWSSKSLKVKVRWTTQEKEKNVYRLTHEKGATHAAYVSREKRVAAFPDIIRHVTFEHEIGHVLGFPDMYFDIFNYKKCLYESWYRNDDIMSGASKLLVPESHFKELDRQYPLTKKVATN